MIIVFLKKTNDEATIRLKERQCRFFANDMKQRHAPKKNRVRVFKKRERDRKELISLEYPSELKDQSRSAVERNTSNEKVDFLNHWFLLIPQNADKYIRASTYFRSSDVLQ